jgi:hypothetical protein
MDMDNVKQFSCNIKELNEVAKQANAIFVRTIFSDKFVRVTKKEIKRFINDSDFKKEHESKILGTYYKGYGTLFIEKIV